VAGVVGVVVVVSVGVGVLVVSTGGGGFQTLFGTKVQTSFVLSHTALEPSGISSSSKGFTHCNVAIIIP
jgi:hypothetical protein